MQILRTERRRMIWRRSGGRVQLAVTGKTCNISVMVLEVMMLPLMMANDCTYLVILRLRRSSRLLWRFRRRISRRFFLFCLRFFFFRRRVSVSSSEESDEEDDEEDVDDASRVIPTSTTTDEA